MKETGENPKAKAVDYFPGYCLTCKTHVLVHAGERMVLMNGREAKRGNCPVCKFKIYQISSQTVSPDEFQEFRMSEIREETKKLREEYNRLKKEEEWLHDPITQATLKWANFFEN